jgi:MFS transporter, ACS family, tartrate transporter
MQRTACAASIGAEVNRMDSALDHVTTAANQPRSLRGRAQLTGPDSSRGRLWRKVYWRTIPILGLAYLSSYIDRVNMGYIAAPMSKDLGLSATDVGFAAGIFFLGYIVMQVPGNLIQYRVGARAWITRILIAWALITAATAAVDSAATLYLARTLLGFAEGGLPAGILLYFTSWMPRSQRSRALSYFFLVLPISAVIGALVASFLLGHEGLVFGLTGWRSVFLAEGILTLLIGVLVWFTLTDKPQDASWLTSSERKILRAELDRDNASAQAVTVTSVRASLRDRHVWALAFADFAIAFGLFPLAIFLPKMIIVVQHSLHNSQAVLITAIPQLIAAVVMIAWARVARRRSPAVATMIPAAVAAVALAAAAYASNALIFVSAVCVAAAGIYSAIPQFWRLPSLRLSGPAAAAGLALINSVGNFSGFAGSYITGFADDITGNFRYALLLITVIMLLGVLTIAFVGRSALPSPTPRAAVAAYGAADAGSFGENL